MKFLARAAHLALVPLFALVACTEDPDNDVEVAETDVQGGIVTAGYEWVGLLFIEVPDQAPSLCTAWLAGPRHVITAAHCVADTNATITYVENATLNGRAIDGIFHNVTRVTAHPNYIDGETNHDIAIVRLQTAPGGTPAQISSSVPPANSRGRIVGFGDNEFESGSGVKRYAHIRIGRVFNDGISIFGWRNSCPGDSGGPIFADGPNGPVVFANVVGGITGQCGDSDHNTRHARIDLNRGWILSNVAGATACTDTCDARACGGGGCGWDCGSCQTGQLCSAAGACTCPFPSDRFGWSYCSAACPCGAGSGDCDSDNDCSGALSCSQNVGANYGVSASLDICEANTVCPPASENFGWSFCSENCRCGVGQGDCDGDAECAPGLICRSNVGRDYNVSTSLDVCERPARLIWDLDEDFRVYPNQANPSPGRLGTPNVWSYRRSSLANRGNLATHTLLPHFHRITTTYQRWEQSDQPLTAPNVEARHTNVRNTIRLHPGTPGNGHELVVVRWRSPFNGTIDYTWSLRNETGTAACGACDGINFWVYENGRQAASGGMDAGGRTNPATRTLAVRTGQTLEFIVGPRANNSFDRAVLDLRIEAR